MNGLALTSGKQDLIINPPIMNSAGILGFIPDDNYPFGLNHLGAFVTHPISLKRRQPAQPPHFERFPGGALLHTGLPNPGIRKALHDHRNHWEMHSQPVILHILANDPQDMKAIVEQLDAIDHPVQALEIGLTHTTPDNAEAIFAVATLSQLPILARVHPDTDHEVQLSLMQSGVNAVVIGPPRGSLTTVEQARISGRLYGPGLQPMASYHLERFLNAMDIPVILGCGLFSAEDIRGAFSVGAAAIQLDTMLWLDPARVLENLTDVFDQPIMDI
jgi:dihydroorotate dehydrogenase